jgi:hypothetical protein
MGNILEGITKDLKKIPDTVKKKAKSLDAKQVTLKVLPYAIFGYVADKSLKHKCGLKFSGEITACS